VRQLHAEIVDDQVRVRAGPVLLEGDLSVPEQAHGVVLFAHGSGSSRHSPRNRAVAAGLREAGFATLLVDLLTLDEEEADEFTGHLRFDIDLLADRLVGATAWLLDDSRTCGLPLGYFGASTGAAAALVAAARRSSRVHAVVSRGGRPDLAGPTLHKVQAPTLLIVGSEDHVVVDLNRQALHELKVSAKELVVVAGATHLFEEPGALEEVTHLARAWFHRYLGAT
jgi:pimeloyl-ACP methyl ester carboxylesterase